LKIFAGKSHEEISGIIILNDLGVLEEHGEKMLEKVAST
jgi:hypothetical protein